MFDTYMDANALDPRMRRRMTWAMGTAVLACALAITTYSGAERLSITRVGAPQVEMDFLLATTVASPMAAPPPPAPQEVAAAAPSSEPSSDPEPTRVVQDFDDVLERPSRGTTGNTPTTHGGTGTVPGAPVGSPTGIGMPCLGGHCTIGIPSAAPRKPPTDDTAKVPLSVVEGRVRFSPDPPRDALRATRAGELQRGGTSVVEFCVDTDGKVDRVATKRSAGDGDIDRICRDTLKRWRFSPLQVQGRATRMCSEMAFVIAFE